MKGPFGIFFFLLTFLSFSYSQNPCAIDSSLHIVVLGSSTAAGSGANPSDSAWVNLYRDHLQGLYPDHQVTNLARGGYATYWLMPDHFIPPAGRPSPDSTRNITKAISLAPDAIIVNLPSNDVSLGYTVTEQLDNFATIIGAAQSNNIPIWVSTTQPKNYSNPISIQKQLTVRDSLLAKYSPNVFDFWTGLAAPDDQLDPAFDSGDGTHLNNAGHFLLFSRVRDANLPEQLISSPDFIDYSIVAWQRIIAPDCGVNNSRYSLSIVNRGTEDDQDLAVQWGVKNQNTGEEIIYRDTLFGGLQHCEEHDFFFEINSSEAGDYLFNLSVEATNDGDLSNNTLQIQETFVGVPYLDGTENTTCVSTSTVLSADAAIGDSIRWYDAAQNGNWVGAGPIFQTPVLDASTSYFAEAVRGVFLKKDTLIANDQFDRDWNGIMFDLQATVDLSLDSLEIKVDTFGSHFIDLYTRAGSHLGYELDPSTWTYEGTYPIEVSSPSEWTAIDLNGWSMQAGDSLAIYMALQNPANTLFYLAVPEPVTRSTGDLTLFSGSGISPGFSDLYFPRDWNGRIYYQVNQEDGDCSSGRMEVTATVSLPTVNLGNDTTLIEDANLLLAVDPALTVIEWSDGSTGQNLLVEGAVWGVGFFDFEVIVEDAFACRAYDTIRIEFTPVVDTSIPVAATFRSWPNPVRSILFFECPVGKWKVSLKNQLGQVLLAKKSYTDQRQPAQLDVETFPVGIYFLELKNERGERLVKKIILQ